MDYIAIIDISSMAEQIANYQKSTDVGVGYAEGITIYRTKEFISTNCLMTG